MSDITFEVDGKPAPQGSHRCFNGNVVAVGSKALKVWRTAMGWAARSARPIGWDSSIPVEVEAVFILPRPKHHYRTNGQLKDSAPRMHTTRPDLDKLARALGDSLTSSTLVDDDSLILRWRLDKVYGQQPGVHVHLRQMTGGVSDQQSGSGDDRPAFERGG